MRSKEYMELWIARDKDGMLNAFVNTPSFSRNGVWYSRSIDGEDVYHIDAKLFPQVTWENSPQRVKIEIMEK